MMNIKNGNLTKHKIVLAPLIIFSYLISFLYAQEVDVAPLINLDELEPSYDEDINHTENKINFDNQLFNDSENFLPLIPTAKIRILNKITAKVDTIDIELKKNITYEELNIYAIDCYKSKPNEQPETAIYLNVHYDKTMKKIFNGWMIKSIPSISSMEHPIYDLWVEECYKS